MARWMILFLGAVSASWAGGFWLTVHSAPSPLGRKTPGAAVLVEVGGCAKASDAKLEGVAQRAAGDQRTAVPLEFLPTSQPNIVAVRKTWPEEGTWTLDISGRSGGVVRTVRVDLGPNDTYRVRR